MHEMLVKQLNLRTVGHELAVSEDNAFELIEDLRKLDEFLQSNPRNAVALKLHYDTIKRYTDMRACLDTTHDQIRMTRLEHHLYLTNDKLRTNVVDLREDVHRVETKLDNLAVSMGSRMDSLETRMGSLESRMYSVESQVTAIRVTLDLVLNELRRNRTD